MTWVDNNPVRLKALEKYNKQSEKVKNALDKLREIDQWENRLKIIKKTRPKIKTGDLFLANLFGDMCFYGVVLNGSVDIPVYGDNLVIVCIFKHRTKSVNDTGKNYDFVEEQILLNPRIVTREYWTGGFFYNIGINIAEDMDLNYGFYSSQSKSYINEYGEKKAEEPRVVSTLAIETITGIASEMRYALTMDNSFLTPEERKEFNEYIKAALDSGKDSFPEKSKDGAFVFEKENRKQCFVTLGEIERYQELFAGMQGEVEGNGYDWEAVVRAFLKELYPKEEKRINFDSEAEMFCMYCSDEALMKELSEKLTEMLRSGEVKKYISEADFLSI